VLKDALAGSDLEAIKDGTEKLVSVSQSFSQRLYEQTSTAQSSGGGDAGSAAAADSNDDDVVDAEIVDEQ
jgi:molecular chaperone DnaK